MGFHSFERTFPMELLQRLKDSKGSSLKKESHELTGDPDKPPSAPGVRATRLSSPRNREIRHGNSAVLRQGRSWTREPARRGLERRGTDNPATCGLDPFLKRLKAPRLQDFAKPVITVGVPYSNALVDPLSLRLPSFARAHARTQARTHARTHARTRVRARTHTNTRTRTRTHARTHAHTHTRCFLSA